MERYFSKGILSSMRKYYFLLIFAVQCTTVLAQQFPGSVAIGTVSPAPSNLVLQLVSTTKAFQPPVMSTTQQNAISGPREGSIVYDNILHQLSNFNGTGWVAVGGTPSIATTSSAGTVFAKGVVTHQFLTGIGSGTGSPSSAQAAFTDISGSVAASQLPNPSASTLGGVESAAAVTHQWINSISTSGVPALSQPAFTDISGVATAAQLPAPTATNLGGVKSLTATTHQWINTISTAGAPSSTQPAFSDISGSVASTQFPALTGDVTSTAGTVATTVGKIQGIAVATTSPITNQVLQYNGTSWQPGTAPTGGTNWITAGDAETNSITGWTVYNDGSSSSPVDCTGGTVVGTPLTVVNTSPLSGTYSYLWTHGASNTQGTGFSYAFTLDTASATKVENTQFDMTVASGTWVAGVPQVSDSDQTIWIYDVDSSTLIQPTTYRIYSGNAGSFHFQTYWQPAVSTSRNYRLCVHNATTTATAYTTKFDSFSIAPSTYTYGTPITDWMVYTPTFTGFGTVASPNVFSRRVAGSLEVLGSVTAGTPTAVTAIMTLGYGGTNGNVAIDFTKIGGADFAGDCGSSSGGSTTFFRCGILTASSGSASSVQFGVQTSTTALFGSYANGSAIAQSAQSFHVKFSVPIVGWSSGVQMSDSAPQTGIAFSGSQATQSVTANTTNITFTTSIDRTASWNGTQFVVPVAGDYTVTGSVVLSVAGTFEVYRNGSPYLNSYWSSANNTVSAGSIVVTGCAAGDTLSLRPTATGTATLGTLGIFKLSDPRTTGATETVSAIVNTPTNTVATNTTANVVFGTVEYDDHGAFASGVFKAPYPGMYEHCAQIYASGFSATTANNGLEMVLAKNGSQLVQLGHWFLPAATSFSQDVLMNGCRSLRMNAGDTANIVLINSATGTGTATITNANSYYSVKRVGN